MKLYTCYFFTVERWLYCTCYFYIRDSRL